MNKSFNIISAILSSLFIILFTSMVMTANSSKNERAKGQFIEYLIDNGLISSRSLYCSWSFSSSGEAACSMSISYDEEILAICDSSIFNNKGCRRVGDVK